LFLWASKFNVTLVGSDPRRAADAALAFFMGRLVERSFTRRPIKKAAQVAARLGSFVAPLGLQTLNSSDFQQF